MKRTALLSSIFLLSAALADQPPNGPGDFQITPEQRAFWSFRPVRRPELPTVRDTKWARSDLDRFILARLEAADLRPTAEADKRTFVRRATFDLTGLPPTPQQIDSFLKDNSPEASEKLVDRLLASPAYGERWARHWLDLVRYTDSFDSRGIGGEMDCADAYRYRDWVIKALNSDMPYDRFAQMQIAGDRLPDAGIDGIVATGILAFGNWGGGDADKEKLLTDIADDQLDVVSRTFMGVTLACARCHDHKFDPFSQKDYYGLAGIFFSTHILPNVGPKTNGPPMLRIPLETAANRADREKRIARIGELDRDLKTVTETQNKAFVEGMLNHTSEYLLALWDSQHGAKNQTLNELSKQRKLHAFALRRWADLLAGGNDQLLGIKVNDVGGKPGISGWRAEAGNPSMAVNTTDEDARIASFVLPAKSVSVHPGPKSDVIMSWRSPIQGLIRISGQVIDADPVCGDGVAWAVDHRTAAGRKELAAGAIPNGGRQKFPDKLTMAVQPGDAVEFVIMRKGEYTCDTTTLDITITTADGSKSWNLAQDWMNDPHSGNPHADRFGNPGVWSAADAGERVHGKDNAIPELASWQQLQKTNSTSEERKKAADEIQKKFRSVNSSSPFWPGSIEDEAVLPHDVRTQLGKIRNELEALRKLPAQPTAFANGAQEGGVPGSPHAGPHDVRLHMRGRYDKLGDLVPRRFPEILAGKEPPKIKNGSGRLELAQWLTDPKHPLTPRVIVNRIWQYHFGEGIVRTPSNFGKLGEKPTHPELLDWLADEFMRGGWSLKKLHRTIILSASYRQSSVAEPETLKRDPENRLFGRMNRRRLEAEELRDAVLAVTDRLSGKPGGPASRELNAPRRSVYLITIRSDRDGFGPLFDVADCTAPIEKRTVSTVAPQALFLLNNPFMTEAAAALAKQVQAVSEDSSKRIDWLYRRTLGRAPAADETKLCLRLLERLPAESAWPALCQTLLCSNEFVYVD